MHEICSGINSYDDLAATLNVTRGTIYRRIEKLEEMHAITKKIMAIPDYRNLNLSAIFIGMDAVYDDMDKVINAIRALCDTVFVYVVVV